MRITLILLAFLITSCGAYKRKIIAENCFSKEVQSVIKIDTTITTDTLLTTFSVNCDSLIAIYDIQSITTKDTVYIHDTVNNKIVAKMGVLIHSDSIANIYYSVTSKGYISFKVKIKPQKKNVQFQKIVSVKNDCPKFTLNWFQRNAMNFFWLLVIIVLWQIFKKYLYIYLNKG